MARAPEPDISLQPPWANSTKYVHEAVGTRDVLLIISESDTSTSNSDGCLTPRRTREELTRNERSTLESQGIPRDCHHDEASIMRRRYTLDGRCHVVDCIGSVRELTCEAVIKQIASLMNNTDKQGITVHYIGHGKRDTGDWCFSDGYITLRELLNLYMSNQHFKGRMFSINSDCSYSGRWVKECMEFMDEQGVGPCGHAAKEKGTLIKVLASCLSNEIPAKNAFTVNAITNDKNTGELRCFSKQTNAMRHDEIYQGQHPCVMDFTWVKCNKLIDDHCTMAPGTTWQKWRVLKRIFPVVLRKQGVHSTWWYIVLCVDDEDTIRLLHERVTGKCAVNVEDYGEILKLGIGEKPPPDVIEWVKEEYGIDYRHTATL